MIAVVGDGAAAESAAAALEAAGYGTERIHAGAVGDAELAVAGGEAAVIDLVAADYDGAVLPVGAERGLPSADPEGVGPLVEAYRRGDAGTRNNPLLAVEADADRVGVAAFDAMLVRSEPGRISEYSVAGGAARSRFRADGVVAATPAGSHGYARAAGGPRLEPDSGAVAVVPVAVFGMGTPAWVFDPAAGIEIRVERDEGDVSLLVDGRERGRLAGEAAVTLSLGGTIETVVPPG